MRKTFSRIVRTVFMVGLVCFLLLNIGALGLGEGSGNGGKGDNMDDAEEITITIVVTQDKYLIDEQEVTLSQIKEKVTDKSTKIKVILEDNYASAKAWDDIKASLTEWGVVAIEQ